MGNQYYGASGLRAIKAFFANTGNFTGRSSRKEFWWWQLVALLVLAIVGGALVFAMFGSLAAVKSGNTGAMHGGQVVALITFLLLAFLVFAVTLLPGLTLGMRRFRDAGVPGWLSLIMNLLIVLSRLTPAAVGDQAMVAINWATVALILIEEAICCLPSRRAVTLTTRGFNVKWFQQAQMLFELLILGGVVFVILSGHLPFLFGILLLQIWETALSVTINRAMQDRASRLWAWADAQGLDAAALQQRTGLYTAEQWAASRPAHLQFVPARGVIDQLVGDFSADSAS
ncbi:DUF805 domain-containing protein [Lacticaseibacillus camelliae]|nr:DUF805 domain-containing protein [Lacticaseibacillus camelliae]